jgi:hypothetical protein
LELDSLKPNALTDQSATLPISHIFSGIYFWLIFINRANKLIIYII